MVISYSILVSQNEAVHNNFDPSKMSNHNIKIKKMKTFNLNTRKIQTGILAFAGLLIAIILMVSFTNKEETTAENIDTTPAMK